MVSAKFLDIPESVFARMFEVEERLVVLPCKGLIQLNDDTFITDVPKELWPEGIDLTMDVIEIAYSRQPEGNALMFILYPMLSMASVKKFEFKTETCGISAYVDQVVGERQVKRLDEMKGRMKNLGERKRFQMQSHPESRRGIYWDPQWSKWIAERSPMVTENDEDLFEMVQDLDRRFIQLWDKQQHENYDLLKKFMDIMSELYPHKSASEIIADLTANEFSWFTEYGQPRGNYEDLDIVSIPVDNKEEFEFWHKHAMALKDKRQDGC